MGAVLVGVGRGGAGEGTCIKQQQQKKNLLKYKCQILQIEIQVTQFNVNFKYIANNVLISVCPM